MDGSIITPTNPEFSVGSDVRVGDTLVVGGPGATFSCEVFVDSERRGQHSNLIEGDEVRVLEVERQFHNLPLVRVSGGGSYWAVERFSLPGKPVKVERTVSRTRVLVFADDFDVNLIPTRSYDPSKGDRRFTTLEFAMDHALKEESRTGIQQVVRRDPGSYSFQELKLVQAVGS